MHLQPFQVREPNSWLQFKLAICVVVLSVAGLTPRAFPAVSYPYAIPGPVTASLDVNTAIRSPVDDMKLALNFGGISYTGFNDPSDQAKLRSFNPPAIRFPSGVWANFYDWEVDGRRIYDGYTNTYYGAVVNNPNFRYGFPGMTTVHDDLNFNVLFTWNICYDSPAKGVARLDYQEASGFDTKWIELGNENFFTDQRSEAVATPSLYVNVARNHAQALKAADPNIQLSVPVSFRTSSTHVQWNAALAGDQSYYDTITIHRYFDGQLLNADVTMRDTVETARAQFPGKPVWFTEWSVDADGENNALAVMGMANVYLYFFNNMDRIAMNNYYGPYGNIEPFFTFTNNNLKTSYGACYDMVRGVFQGSELFSSAKTSTALASGINAVNAEAVTRDGQTLVFAVNQSTNPAPFTLKFNGVTNTAGLVHRALMFTNANDFRLYSLTADPLTTVASNVTSIVLPPLSVNVLTVLAADPPASELVIEAESAAGQTSFSPYEVRAELGQPEYITMTNGTVTVNYDTVVESKGGIATYEFQMTQAGDISLEALGRFDDSSSDSFWFRVDGGSWVRVDGLTGGPWKWVALTNLPVLSAGSHSFAIARREPTARLDRFRLKSVTGNLAEPLRVMVTPNAVVRIQAEDYNQGGEGMGYHDTTTGNAGGVYRADGVDIQPGSDVGGGFHINSVTPGEWLSYAVNVQTPGQYVLNLRVASASSRTNALRVLAGKSNLTGMLTVPGTGSLTNWTTLSKTVVLEAGRQEFQVKFTAGEMNLNWIEFAPLVASSNALYSELADSGPRKQDGSSPSILTSTASDATLYAGRSGTGGSVDRCVVFPFQLPALGAVANPFTAATFTFDLVSNDFAPTNCNLDLYGLANRATATVLATDFYSETDVADPTAGTSRLQNNLCTSSSTPGLYSTSHTGSSNLVNYLNAQYAGGTNAGRFVFLRLNKDTPVGTSAKKYTVTAADGAATNNAGLPNYLIWPQIQYAVVTTPPANPLIEAPGWTNGFFGFAIQGDSGRSYVVQASTNLTAWESIWTNSAPPPLQFTDPGSTNFNQRYYRVLIEP